MARHQDVVEAEIFGLPSGAQDDMAVLTCPLRRFERKTQLHGCSVVGLVGIWRAQPLNAPCSMPRMKCRWNARYTRQIGNSTTMVPAASSGTFVVNWPTKKPSPAVAVRFCGSWMSTRTSRNWFHDHMKYSTASVDIGARAS